MQPGGPPDLQMIVLKAQQMQADMERAQAELASSRVTGSAGGGLVTAEVSGTGEVVSVTISPDAVDLDDLETLGDLVVAAIRDANREAQELGAETMSSVAGGLGLGAFGLGGLGGGGFPGFPDAIDAAPDDEHEGRA
jgi:nucleoid-associated protein EbfC